MRYEIRTFLRQNVLDQQGQAVTKALNSLGWPSVVKCRVGKVYEIDCDPKDIDTIAKSIYNEVMEDYEIKCIEG